MGFNKKFFTTGGIVASTPPAAAGLDPFQNFETVTYTGNGSTQKITGYIRKGAAFNGSSSYIATSYTLPSDSTMSFSFWVNVAAFGAGDTYIMSDMDSSTNDRRLDFRFNSSGYFMVDVGNGSSNDTGNTDSVTQPTNTWIHFAVVLNGTSLKVYKNGNSTPIVDTTLTVAFGTAGGRSLTLGRAGDYTGSAHLNGKLDQFRIFNTALNSTQVGQLAGETYADPKKSTTDYFGNGSGVALYELDEDAKDTGDTYNGTPANVNFLGMAFQPDFVWVKQRNEALNHVLFDSVRGAGNRIVSNVTIAEDTGGGYGVVNSFDSNGFTVDIQTQTSSNNVNKSGGSYVAWCWKAGGAAVSGTGTSGITNVEVSANTEAGFSIVKYDGGGTAGGTVTHGLDSAPELIIIKRTDDSGDWIVGSDYLTSWGHILQLNLSDAEAGYAGFNSTAPTTSVFTLGSNNPVNNASGSYVAYCFHSVDGYQRIGTYTGASGLRVYTDSNGDGTGTGAFQPRFLMVKKTATANWVIIDSVRVNGIYEDILFPNTDAFEAAGDYDELTFNSDGFTWNQTENTKNAVGGEYIYLAIA